MSILIFENFFKIHHFLLLLLLISTSIYPNIVQKSCKTLDLPRDEIFPPENGQCPSLQGKIIEGRYHAPKNVFSCQAYAFGEGTYTVQDGLLEQGACVGFYNALADFNKAEILFTPGIKRLNSSALKDTFESFGIGILKEVDNAQGIKILKEEMVEDNVFFAAISVEKISFLRASNGKHKPVTRGYLVFQEGDMLAILSNQRVTLPGQKHDPQKYVEKLKQGILEFRKTFEFGSIPQENL